MSVGLRLSLTVFTSTILALGSGLLNRMLSSLLKSEGRGSLFSWKSPERSHLQSLYPFKLTQGLLYQLIWPGGYHFIYATLFSVCDSCSNNSGFKSFRICWNLKKYNNIHRNWSKNWNRSHCEIGGEKYLQRDSIMYKPTTTPPHPAQEAEGWG